MSVYAVSDLHGQYEAFEKGLKEINFGKDDFLYVLGDAIDRGPDGVKILQKVKDSPNMELLIGNHELFMLSCISGESLCIIPSDINWDTYIWMEGNGGDVTYEAFKILPDEEKRDIIRWLSKRPAIVRIHREDRDIILTHSHYIKEWEDMPAEKIPENALWDIVWLSAFRMDYYNGGIDYFNTFPEQFIVGHVPMIRLGTPYLVKNVCNIDGGCAYAGIQSQKLSVGPIFLNIDTKEYIQVVL